MKILINLTSRSRRNNLLRAIDSVVNNVSDKNNYHILISLENKDHDPTMNPLPTLNCNHSYRVNPYRPTSKVDAINRDVNEFTKLYDWSIIINHSDDMVFTQKGFDDIIREQFKDSLDKCLHFPDSSAGNKLITMSILGRDYYNRFGYIYHPSYQSLYCDNETMDVAKALNRYFYVDKQIFVHLHPANGNAPNDDQYRFTESFHPIDRLNYAKRLARNFDLGNEL